MAKIHWKQWLIVGVFSLSTVGCGALKPKPEQPPVKAAFLTLDDAVVQIHQAIATLYAQKNKVGMVAAKATVTFKLTTGETQQGAKRTIGITLPSGLGANYAQEGGNSATQGAENTITLEFDNPVLAGKDTILGQHSTQVKPEDNITKWISEQLDGNYGVH